MFSAMVLLSSVIKSNVKKMSNIPFLFFDCL